MVERREEPDDGAAAVPEGRTAPGFGTNRRCGDPAHVRPFHRPAHGSVVPRAPAPVASCAAPRRVVRRGLRREAGSLLARFGSLVLVVALACLVAACGGTTS